MNRIGLILLIAGMARAGAARTAESTESIPPVPAFELSRYLGTWYEIARLPHRFEKGLSRVTATYSLNLNGSIRVLNRGFKAHRNKWSEIEGKAWNPDPAVPAVLRVRFFWPFHAAYRIILLDEGYQWAIVTSGSKKFLWILSRKPVMDEGVYASLVAFAGRNGFDTTRLIRVEQDASESP